MLIESNGKQQRLLVYPAGGFINNVSDKLSQAVPSVTEPAILSHGRNCMVRVIASTGKQIANTLLDSRRHHAEKTQNHHTEKNLAENLHDCFPFP
jgi:hypothetical protein